METAIVAKSTFIFLCPIHVVVNKIIYRRKDNLAIIYEGNHCCTEWQSADIVLRTINRIHKPKFLDITITARLFAYKSYVGVQFKQLFLYYIFNFYIHLGHNIMC